MGPTIHAEVGDTITVVFRNNTRFPVGIHPHGVLYAKASEGAHYVANAAPAGQEQDHGNMPQTGANVERTVYLSLGRAGTGRAGAI
ncbi:MAG: multicopper oxidase domain-containing protein [Methylocella sp.]